MNITDVKKELFGFVSEGDKLDLIFEIQMRLKKKYDEIESKKGLYVPSFPLDVNNTMNQEYLKSLSYRVVSELVEATECLKNKAWKQSEVLTDVDHLKEELADALHFFIEFCIVLGISPDELFELYFKKSEVNKWRQQTKY